MRLDNVHIINTKTSSKTLKKQDGFTLIEVLIAVSIFAVGLLAVAAMQTSAIRVNSTAGELTQLSTWGIDRLEELMSRPYTHADLAAGGHVDPAPPTGYNVTWTVVDDNPTNFTKNITLTVNGKGKTLTLTSIRCRSL